MTRYTYYFNDPITPSTVQSLLDVLYTYPELDIYFSTNGGEMSSMATLIHAFNIHESLNIYLVNILASCGTQLLTDYKGRLHITKNLDLILMHPIKRDLMLESRVNSHILEQQLKEDNEKMIESFEGILTEHEKDRLRENLEIYFYRTDFERFIKENITMET